MILQLRDSEASRGKVIDTVALNSGIQASVESIKVVSTRDGNRHHDVECSLGEMR